jgi:hypothetical protein
MLLPKVQDDHSPCQGVVWTLTIGPGESTHNKYVRPGGEARGLNAEEMDHSPLLSGAFHA